jgi:hypothetical protein
MLDDFFPQSIRINYHRFAADGIHSFVRRFDDSPPLASLTSGEPHQ